jgi:hypothetical protein
LNPFEYAMKSLPLPIFWKNDFMKQLQIFLLAIWIGCGTIFSASAAEDSIRVSLLTCSPGSEIYALFGHTAIRYEDKAKGADWVFNYGMFSFQTPNFVMRFVKGETDYQLGVVPYAYFEAEYNERGSYVEQQVLNLTPMEKAKLFQLLDENYRPENRTYRYNYFYDNCTTRARDKIEESIQGQVVYPESEGTHSFRDIVHQYTAGHEWSEFGIDLCLGSEADKPIDARLQMFAPFYLLRAADGAMIKETDGVERPLVQEKQKIVNPPVPVPEKEFPLTPMQSALILLAITVLIGLLEIYYKKCFWGMDILLFGAQGIAGCIIAFLFFFSVHPTVGSNYLLILFNPIPLIYLPVMVYKTIKGRKDLYHWANILVLTLFIAFWSVIPQKINLVVLPLALSLLIRSLTHIICIYRKQHK